MNPQQRWSLKQVWLYSKNAPLIKWTLHIDFSLVHIVSVTQIFRNSLPSHDGNWKTFKVMTWTYPLGTQGLVKCSFIVSSNTLKKIMIELDFSTWRDILGKQVLLTYMKSSQWEDWYRPFCRNIRLLTDPVNF
jgi:hypothetical protein